MSELEHHVVAGALVAGGRVLLGHRSPSRRWYPDVWDLPGGHVEERESEGQALARELAEELDVQLLEHDPVALTRLRMSKDSHGCGLRLAVWHVRSWRGVPVNRVPREHDHIAWFGAQQLTGLAMAHPAYHRILGQLLMES